MAPVFQEEEIHEPIGNLLVRFDSGRMDPLSFSWRRRDYQVERVNARWTDRNLSPPSHGFTVTLDNGDIFELAYQEGDPIWKLERIFLQ